MHSSSTIQRLWYGLDQSNFYLRMDFKTGVQPVQDLPSQLNLLWFYPDKVMHNTPLPIADVPDVAPLNYLFHHHLQINLSTHSIQFQQAGEYSQWYPRQSNAQVALNNSLELAVPWADLQQPPESILRIVVVLSEEGQFRSYLPENGLIAIELT